MGHPHGVGNAALIARATRPLGRAGGGRRRWLPGTVRTVHADGTYDLDLDLDGVAYQEIPSPPSHSLIYSRTPTPARSPIAPPHLRRTASLSEKSTGIRPFHRNFGHLTRI